jgi:hypothetical protein
MVSRQHCVICELPLFLFEGESPYCDIDLPKASDLGECNDCEATLDFVDMHYCSFCMVYVCRMCWDRHWEESKHQNWLDEDD